MSQTWAKQLALGTQGVHSNFKWLLPQHTSSALDSLVGDVLQKDVSFDFAFYKRHLTAFKPITLRGWLVRVIHPQMAQSEVSFRSFYSISQKSCLDGSPTSRLWGRFSRLSPEDVVAWMSVIVGCSEIELDVL